jgi:hypothetical protein
MGFSSQSDWSVLVSWSTVIICYIWSRTWVFDLNSLKGIVSRDFEVCFLVPLDSSDIATPSGARSFFLKSISCRIFDFSGLGASSFRSVWISAQCTSGAHFLAPDVHMVPLSHSWTWLKYYYVIKSEPRSYTVKAIFVITLKSNFHPILCRTLSGATKWAPDVHWAEIRALQKLLAPRPEKSKFDTKLTFKKTNSRRKG